jgi:leucyl aminopeptidase
MHIEFVNNEAAGAARVVLVFEGGTLSTGARALDGDGIVSRALTAAPRFKGDKGQTLDLLTPAGVDAPRVLLVGAGAQASAGATEIETAAGHAYNALKMSGAEAIAFDARGLSPELAAAAAFGLELASYRFDKYFTKEKPEKKPSVARAAVISDDPAAAQTAWGPLSAVADGVRFTRDLVWEPANVLYPEEFARRVKELERLGLEVEILDETQMRELGMGALLGVGQGSARESRLAVMQWKGAADPNEQPVCFVGKGVCFDTGGISIKPAAGMEDMIWDMGGAGAVAGLMHALAGRKAKVNAVGILGLVENMPDGNAQRPGDVVTSMSGQTIAVLNTDAEGRLVLADALWYAQERFNPRFVIDLATLTGAIIVSLGNDFAGLFCNNDELAGDLLAASAAEGELIWRMPLPPQYDKLIDSPTADMKNIGPGPAGGSITAALFLQRFIRDNTPWAHLDIASTAWRKTANPPQQEGATGFGVRLLNRLVATRFEG